MFKLFLLASLALLLYILASLHMPSSPEIDKELKPYVDTFLSYCDKYGVNCEKVEDFNIKIEDMSNERLVYKLFGIDFHIIGRCIDTANEIRIDEEFLMKETPARIEQLVIHELGHCILNLEHTEEGAISIMHPYILPEYYYLEKYNRLFNEFFSCKDSCPELQFNQEQYL